jgi:hypothetical protein
MGYGPRPAPEDEAAAQTPLAAQSGSECRDVRATHGAMDTNLWPLLEGSGVDLPCPQFPAVIKLIRRSEQAITLSGCLHA